MVKYNNNLSILTQSDGSIVHTIHSGTGRSERHIFDVFPGVRLLYNSIHTGCCPLDAFDTDDLIVIHHCREGRLEQQTEDGFFYLMPGDLSISNGCKPNELYSFPLSHYHGISIVIDPEKAPKCFSCLLDDVEVQPVRIARRLCGERGVFLIRNESYIEHIFSELYSVHENYKKGYLKVKILELLLVLSGIEPQETAQPSLSSTQASVAKMAASYLAQNLDSRITVADLAETFHISQSHLQKAFKGVYGMPIFSYVRVLRMQAAAVQLISTELSVLDIAGSFGYDNASKFSSAFKDIMGETPLEYRKNHRR